jgi:hypothetical protein
MMRTRLQSKDFELSDGEARLFERHAEALRRRLARFDPDLVDLEVIVEKQARRNEFTSHSRLVIMNHALPARRNRAPTVTTLIGRVFEDLEEEVAAFVTALSNEEAWKRKRGARSAPAWRKAGARLQLERALLDEARAGDRSAFDTLAEGRLSGLRKTICEELSRHGREPTNEELDARLSQTLAQAFERLHEKPDRWSLHRWLSWIAQNPPAGRF